MPQDGICRCCLAQGFYKNINASFYWFDNKEVYIDMIKDCFNIELQPLPLDIQNSICEICITELRAAHMFRWKVLNAESRLQERCLQKKFKAEKSTVKYENESIEDCIEDIRYEIDIEMDDNTSEQKHDMLIQKNDKNVAVPVKNLTEKSTENCDEDSRDDFVEDIRYEIDIETDENTLEQKRDDRKQITRTRLENKKRSLNRANDSYILIENSTASPFKWSPRNGFQCFYCFTTFAELDLLREHTLTHETSRLKRLLRTNSKNPLHKVDITDLKCTHCSESMTDLTQLKQHLTESHGKKFFDTKLNLVQFKFTKELLPCCYCDQQFKFFSSLNIHLNSHFDNFVCETCGATFLSVNRIQQHYKMHLDGDFPCNMCNKVFKKANTLISHKHHCHNNKVYKCHCGDGFKTYDERKKHRIEVHKERFLLYKCEFCNVSYKRSQHLAGHIRVKHMNERRYECQICSSRFGESNTLKAHQLTHTKERKYECTVCNKRYGRKTTLKEHMRIHNNDRRFVCSLCGQAFVQKCSLKAHIAKYH